MKIYNQFTNFCPKCVFQRNLAFWDISASYHSSSLWAINIPLYEGLFPSPTKNFTPQKDDQMFLIFFKKYCPLCHFFKTFFIFFLLFFFYIFSCFNICQFALLKYYNITMSCILALFYFCNLGFFFLASFHSAFLNSWILRTCIISKKP